MRKAEELAEEAMEIIMSTKATDWSLEFLADIFQKYIEQYGRLVQEAAAKVAQAGMDANIREGRLQDMNGFVAQYDSASNILEMPLP